MEILYYINFHLTATMCCIKVGIKNMPYTKVRQNTSSWKSGDYYILFYVDHEQVAEWLESSIALRKVCCLGHVSNSGWILVHCPPSSKKGTDCNTGKAKAVRKENVTLPHNADVS